MRLIDADALERLKFHGIEDWAPIESASWQWGWNDAIDAIINNAPTVDAVEVVRCKECRWGTAVKHEFVQGADIRCQRHNCFTNHDSSCSWGERKDEVTK